MYCMSCIEVVARLHLYLDRELTIEEVVTVQQHLSECPSCECRFHFNSGLKRLMRLARLPRGELAGLDPDLEMEIRADLEEWK